MILRREDNSFGIIPFKRVENNWYVLLVQQNLGYWAFPKGHAEKNEKPLEAATRELSEETGLTIEKILDENPLFDYYSFFETDVRIDKKVTFFLALVKGDLKIQEAEISAAKWLLLSEAVEKLTYQESKDLLNKAIEIVSKIQL